MHFKVGRNKKGHLVEEGCQLISYYINQHYMRDPEAKVVFIFDFTDAGVSNLVSRGTSMLVVGGSNRLNSMNERHLLLNMSHILYDY